MILHDFAQYSKEYWALKLARPSASSINKILTSTGKPASSQDTYMNNLLAEDLAGVAFQGHQTDAMARGLEMESEAADYYEFVTDQKTFQMGCITNPKVNEHVIISPDRWSPENKVAGLEIKCPMPPNQVKYLLGQKCPSDYMPQLQCSMWITETEHWDFLSYHPDLDCLLLTVDRDDAWIKLLEEEIDKFMEKFETRRQKLKAA